MKNYYKVNPMRVKYPVFLKRAEQEQIPTIFLSIQTTGFEPGEIIQFSAVKTYLKGGVFVPVSELNLYFKPSTPLPEDVKAFTGLTDEFLSKYGDISCYKEDIRSFFPARYVICAHNAQFVKLFTDYVGINNEIIVNPVMWLDTIQLAQDTIKPGLVKNYSYRELFEFYGFDFPSHDSIVIATDLVRLANRLFVRYWHDMPKTGSFIPVIDKLEFVRQENVDKVAVSTVYGNIYLNCSNYFWEDPDDILLRFFNMDEVQKMVLIRVGASDVRALCQKLKKLKTA